MATQPGGAGRRLFAVVSGAALIVLALAPLRAASAADARAHASSSSGTQLYFVANTSASATAVQFAQQPADSIVTADLVNDSLGYTATSYDSSAGSESQAASVYPGTLVTQGPTLLCSEGALPFDCPVNPPAYPLLADAKYPAHPSASAGPSSSALPKTSPLAASAASATATAGKTDAIGTARTGSAGLVAGSTIGFSTGAQDSHSSVATSRTGVTVTVVSHATNLDIAGLLRIGSITGRVVQQLRHGRPPTDRPSISVSGVTVAGHRARIGRRGITVAGVDGPQLLRRLHSRGITVSPPTVTRDDGKGAARSQISGLGITIKAPLQHLPYVPNPLSGVPPFSQIPGLDLAGTYVTHLRFGAAGAVTSLENDVDGGVGDVGPASNVGVAPQSGPPSQRAPSSRAAGSNRRPSGRSGARAPANGSGRGKPGVSRAVAGPSAFATRPTALALDGFSLQGLYLTMAIGSAAIFAGWRARVAWRGGLAGGLLQRVPWTRGERT